MSLLLARMKMIQSKMNELEWSQLFFPFKVYGNFSRCSKAANFTVLGPIWPNFELIRDVMDVLVTCKNEEDPFKNEGARVFTTSYINFSDVQGQITLRVSCGIWPKFELIQAFMHVLATCKNEDDSIKNEGARVVTIFFPTISLWRSFQTLGQLFGP